MTERIWFNRERGWYFERTPLGFGVLKSAEPVKKATDIRPAHLEGSDRG